MKARGYKKGGKGKRGGNGKRGGKGQGRSRVSAIDKEAKELKLLQREAKEIKTLTKRVIEEAPESGDTESVKTSFAQLPLSQYTQRALKAAKYVDMTQIQRAAIPHALADRDVLGAAKTGSGKTLAFMIPLLEKLYRLRWAAEDGLGALVISPTRELAFQIFEVTRKVGNKHSLSAGLVIGGKDLKEEQGRIGRMNILIATPGRILQHLEQTYGFVTDSLVMIVLDEADRILDLGFKKTLNAIMSFMPPPPQRQTLLFSATQTRRVKDLARLSLNKPEYVAVHEKSEHATPKALIQTYVVCPIGEKLNVLFSFIKTHLRDKMLIFFSSCKQVKFVFECFRRIRPGIALMALHGKVKQMKRLAIYEDFQQQTRAVLFATDIAARGLDFDRFPLDWVVQYDCPESSESYIHRVGRTARHAKAGKALLMLLPSEEPMAEVLAKARVPMKRIELNPKKQMVVVQKVRALVAEHVELKTLAQKALVSYVRSVHLQPNKDVFDSAALDLDALAQSMGLTSTPHVHFLKGGNTRKKSRLMRNRSSEATHLREQLLREMQGGTADGAARALAKASAVDSRRMRVTPLGLGGDDSEENSGDDSDSDGDAVLVRKKTPSTYATESAIAAAAAAADAATAADTKKRKLKVKPRAAKSHLFFDDSSRQMTALEASAGERSGTKPVFDVDMNRMAAYQQQIAAQMDVADEADRVVNRERVREKHKEQRKKRRRLDDEDGEEGPSAEVQHAQLACAEPEETASSSEEESSEEEEESSEEEEEEGRGTASAEQLVLQMLKKRRNG